MEIIVIVLILVMIIGIFFMMRSSPHVMGIPNDKHLRKFPNSIQKPAPPGIPYVEVSDNLVDNRSPTMEPARPVLAPAIYKGDKRPLPAPAIPSIDDLMPYLAKVSDRPEPATEHQIKAVDEIGFPGDASKLAKGQASAGLSARDYFEGVLYAKIGDTSDMPADKLLIVNLMTAFILKHEGVRNRAIA